MKEKKLYPLKFKPIFKEKIWGGHKIDTMLGRDTHGIEMCGESWEVSGIEDSVSVVENGELKGLTLHHLIADYGEELLGKKVVETYGNEFPLLVKYIDANDDLSIQVHPDDALAKERHNCNGKTEMWYVLQAEKEAKLISGFNQPMDKEKYLTHLQNNTLLDILNEKSAHSGDAFYMPAGRVHAIGSGVLLLEIQQSSDITYRIYDYNRTDSAGKRRELHTAQALNAIDFTYVEDHKVAYQTVANQPTSLTDSPFFQVDKTEIVDSVALPLRWRNSFTILTVVEGAGELETAQQRITLSFGDVYLLPACLNKAVLSSKSISCKVLESYIP